MADFDLIFEEQLSGNPRPLDLVFGALDTGLSAQTGTLAVALALPTVSASGTYSINNPHRMYGGAAVAWRVASPLQPDTSVQWARGDRIEAAKQGTWVEASALHADTQLPYEPTKSTKLPLAAPWVEAPDIHVEAAAPHQEADRSNRPMAASPWQEGTDLRADAAVPHQERLRTARPQSTSAWNDAKALTRDLLARIGAGAKRHTSGLLPWQIARRPPAGKSDTGTVVPPIDKPDYVPPIATAVDLLFAEKWDGSTTIIFGGATDTSGTVVVPVKSVYIVINTTTLIRLSDGRAIPVLAASASLDVDSWVWSFNASVPSDQQQYVEDPGEMLQVSLNGTAFAFYPERLSRTRSFGQSAIAIQGRGRQAVLDAPTQTFTNTSARTANQLVNDVLTVNGVPLATAVTWNLTDWLVPAGSFSHQGSFISAINAIAASAGGYVQPENSTDGLRILHRYPVMPWNWATTTPDFTLPSSVIEYESIEWLQRADYNRVFVSGTGAGVLAQVTRTGSDGSLVAPMVTDALITHADAARQRGMAVLGATGRSAMVGLRLPVLQATGVIRPGAFVKYNDGGTERTGMVRSTNWSIEGAETWQTIGVETYEPV